MTASAPKSISQALADLSTIGNQQSQPGNRCGETTEGGSRQLSRLVFVGGCPRSGTTLVQRVLDCHPEIYAGPEFDFVPPLADLFRAMQESIRSGRIDAILGENNLIDAFRSLLASLLLPKLEAEGLSFLSEKTPGNVLAFDWLEKCAPESKKILVLRDPRDVVNSMLEVGRRQRQRTGRASGFVRDTVAAVDYMNQCLSAGTAFAEKTPNCLVVYYEDIVSDPLSVANQMYHFIGVHELGDLDLENERFEEARNQESWIDWATTGTISGGIQKDRIGAAAKRLKQSDLEYILLKSIVHPLLSKRYPIDPIASRGRSFAARRCKLRCMVSRIKNQSPALWKLFRRHVMG